MKDVKKFADVEIPKWLKWTLGVFYIFVFFLGGPLLWAIVGLLTMVAWGAVLSWRGIPKDGIAHKMTAGARGPEEYGEGWHFIIPILQEMSELVLYNMNETDIDVWVTCRDKLKIRIIGSVQWWPQKGSIMDFIRVSAAIITGALRDAFEEEIGNIAAVHTSDQMIEKRELMQVIMDCRFRLSIVPHLNPRKALNEEMPDDPPIADLTEDPIAAEGIITFYERPEVRARVLKKLRTESERKNDRSKIEIDHGVDITSSSIARVAFSEAIEAANEREREAKEEVKAIEIKRRKLKEIRDELRGEEVQPKEAMLGAEVQTGLSKRDIQEKVFDVRGVQGVVDIKIGSVAKELLAAGDKPEDKKEDNKEDNKKEGG